MRMTGKGEEDEGLTRMRMRAKEGGLEGRKGEEIDVHGYNHTDHKLESK